MSKILVTGATGYVGAHTVKILAEAGYDIDGLDFKNGNNIDRYCRRLHYNLTNSLHMHHIEQNYDIVVHCAAFISPAESMKCPIDYYENNVWGTIQLLDKMKCKHFIFASTGSAQDPVSPYSKSKVMCEQIIKDHCKSKGIDYTIFRFFNVAGNDGEFAQTVAPIHIMKRAAMAAAGKLDKFTIFGNDYATRDGTCVRDYVHPSDIGRAILRCLHYPANTDYENLAYHGRVPVLEDGIMWEPAECKPGYTNNEIIATMKKVTGIDFPVEYGPRREGDAPVFVVDNVSEYFKAENTIEDMCRQEYEMEKNNDNV
jgi:UDP-glucose 4-epimerase